MLLAVDEVLLHVLLDVHERVEVDGAARSQRAADASYLGHFALARFLSFLTRFFFSIGVAPAGTMMPSLSKKVSRAAVSVHTTRSAMVLRVDFLMVSGGLRSAIVSDAVPVARSCPETAQRRRA